ncbi:hypothetical protein K438DRAFT_2012393 [Mycena galopus ATCC 62051]|nr:hypothetical protein K438DRAFT_2012393 [Mycena galopus ATCC 62051]
MSSSAIDYLVSFLTRPLMKIHPSATILSLQVSLHAAFSSAPPTPSLLLSAKCPPPPALQRACVVAGMRWVEWIHLLSRGIDVQIFLTESSVAVGLGSLPRRIVWVAPANVCSPAVKPGALLLRSSALLPPSPPGARIRAVFHSSRPRNCRGAALNPTRIPTLLSSSYLPDSDSESDLDSDSDSDSEMSDSGCSFTSTSSASSVWSASPSSPSSGRTPASVSPAKPKPDVVKQYTYQGGITQVVSGRVMLGAPSKTHLSNGRPSGTGGNAARSRKVGASSACQIGSWRNSVSHQVL